jgi:DNA-binding MarR family transcriptional regulator
MEEIGKFRMVSVDDLARFYYQGNRSQMEYALRLLSEQGLVERRTVTIPRGRLRVVFLRKEGKALVEQQKRETGSAGQAPQRVYANFVKPAEIAHDAAIYRMYQAEAKKIRASGGRIRRVILDYELKKKVYSPLAKVRRRLPPEEFRKRQAEVARENGLEVIEGKIPLPDLRIEYETREGEIAKIDLELATEHYKAGQVAQKTRAGFKMYIAGSTRRLGSAVWEERELTAEILSL